MASPDLLKADCFLFAEFKSRFMRNKLFAVSLIIFAAAIAEARLQTEPWTKFSSPEGRFSILMPSEPLRDDQTKETPVGEVVMHFLTSRTGTGIFVVAYADYAINDAKRELDANRDSFLKGMKATLVSESDIKLQENPGRDIKSTRDGLSIRSRIYLVGKRYYQAVAITPASLPGEVEADKFLTSFELLSAKSAAK